MEELDDELETIWDVRNPWICLISQNKNVDSFLFSPKCLFFLQFSKKTFFFMKIVWFCQNCKAMRFFIFCTKNKNGFLGIESVTKFWKFSGKASRFMSLKVSQQARFNVNVFCIFLFFTKRSKMKAFSGQVEKIFPKNTSKTMLNWLKSLNFNQFEHVWNVPHKQESTCMVFELFVCFHKCVILKGVYW